ncbi:MAG TPA: pyridoxal phosphate-dependent aminotransferase [Bacteroidia bacterium]|nr:pyridoxal phosphate-dependent aminotransferase [Bacteroidia bacterium]
MSEEKLAARLSKISESQTLAMARKSRELQALGKDIISLSIGEPDYDTPDFIKLAAKNAIDQNYTHYTPVAGFQDLRVAIANKFKRDNNINYSPEQIVVSTGAKQSIANVVLSLVDVGDEVIVPIPYWVSYIELIKLADGIPVYIHAGVDANFKITPAQLEASITPKTKMIIFSTPCNPSGSVYSKQELKKLVDVLEKYPNVYVVSDEIYEHINFVGKHESIAQFESIYNRVITINGVSKGFAMTGWRIGYIGAPLWIAKACEKMQGQFTSGTCSIAQRAALSAVSANPDVVIPMRDGFLKRRNMVLEMLKDIPGLKTNVPDGAFYVFPDISAYFGKSDGETMIKNSADLCMYLLNTANLALVSGDAFGDDNCVRFSYATSEDKIIEAIKRLKNALAQLK